MKSISWAPAAYVRLLRSAHQSRVQISELLDAGVPLHRVESLYPFDESAFANAFLQVAHTSPQRMRELLTSPPASGYSYWGALTSDPRLKHLLLGSMFEDATGRPLLAHASESDKATLLAAAGSVSLLPVLLHALSKVDMDAVAPTPEGYYMLVGLLPGLEVWMSEKLALLEANESSLPPALFASESALW